MQRLGGLPVDLGRDGHEMGELDVSIYFLLSKTAADQNMFSLSSSFVQDSLSSQTVSELMTFSRPEHHRLSGSSLTDPV